MASILGGGFGRRKPLRSPLGSLRLEAWRDREEMGGEGRRVASLENPLMPLEPNPGGGMAGAYNSAQTAKRLRLKGITDRLTQEELMRQDSRDAAADRQQAFQNSLALETLNLNRDRYDEQARLRQAEIDAKTGNGGQTALTRGIATQGKQWDNAEKNSFKELLDASKFDLSQKSADLAQKREDRLATPKAEKWDESAERAKFNTAWAPNKEHFYSLSEDKKSESFDRNAYNAAVKDHETKWQEYKNKRQGATASVPGMADRVTSRFQPDPAAAPAPVVTSPLAAPVMPQVQPAPQRPMMRPQRPLGNIAGGLYNTLNNQFSARWEPDPEPALPPMAPPVSTASALSLRPLAARNNETVEMASALTPPAPIQSPLVRGSDYDMSEILRNEGHQVTPYQEPMRPLAAPVAQAPVTPPPAPIAQPQNPLAAPPVQAAPPVAPQPTPAPAPVPPGTIINEREQAITELMARFPGMSQERAQAIIDSAKI